MFSGVVLVDGRPERSSLLTDFRPSLKRLYHKKIFFVSWHYLRRLPVAFGGFLQQFFLRMKQNLMQILCSLKSVISVVKNRRITKVQPHKNALNLITLPLSLTIVGTLIHKAQC
jgi:hypothetical protein